MLIFAASIEPGYKADETLARNFAQIYKDGVTRADQQYNKNDWVVATPKTEEQDQEAALDDAA